MGATPSHEDDGDDVAGTEDSDDDDDVIKMQHRARFRVSTTCFFYIIFIFIFCFSGIHPILYDGVSIVQSQLELCSMLSNRQVMRHLNLIWKKKEIEKGNKRKKELKWKPSRAFAIDALDDK